MNISAEAMRVSSLILRNIAHELAIDLDHDNASAIHELHKASDALWEAARLLKSNTPQLTGGTDEFSY